MSFLNPFFLFALAAVILPLAIHLLNLKRPKRVLFSTLAFFEELQNSTIRRIKIKKYVLLALRILAVACLAMVLARPFLPPVFGFMTNSKQPAIIALLFDNSISMSRVGPNGPLNEQALRVIDEIVSSAGDEDRFLLQTTSGSPLNTSVLSASQLNRELGKLELNLSGSYTASRLQTLSNTLKESPFQNKKLFFISDGQFSADLGFTEASESLPKEVSATFVKLEEVVVQNTYVSGVSSFTSLIGVGSPFNIQVAVTNGSSVAAANQFLSLQINGETMGQYPLELQSGETQSYAFSLIPEKIGSLNGKLLIEGDEFAADNSYYFTIDIPDKRKVLLVREKSTGTQDFSFTKIVLDAPARAEAQLQYEQIDIDALSQTDFAGYNAVILEELNHIPEYAFDNLRDFVQSGKGILLFPSQNSDIRNYNDFLSLFNAGRIENVRGEYGAREPIAVGSDLLHDHPVFNGLFERSEEEKLTFTTPNIYYYYKMDAPESGSVLSLLSLNTKEPLVREKQFGQGKIIISAIGNGPEWSDFPVKALYPPFYYRTILYAASSQSGGFASHTLGQKFVWEGNMDSRSVKISANDHSITVAPQNLGGSIRLEYPGEDLQAGWIEVSDESREAFVAANLPAEESNFLSPDALDTLTSYAQVNMINAGSLSAQQLTESIKSSGFGKEIWNWFLLAGILLLFAESLVSVYFKAETIS